LGGTFGAIRLDLRRLRPFGYFALPLLAAAIGLLAVGDTLAAALASVVASSFLIAQTTVTRSRQERGE